MSEGFFARAAALIALPSAHADVLYSFSVTGGSVGAFSWAFTEPSFIASNTTVTAANLMSVVLDTFGGLFA